MYPHGAIKLGLLTNSDLGLLKDSAYLAAKNCGKVTPAFLMHLSMLSTAGRVVLVKAFVNVYIYQAC